jgi:hypothetical protein
VFQNVSCNILYWGNIVCFNVMGFFFRA